MTASIPRLTRIFAGACLIAAAISGGQASAQGEGGGGGGGGGDGGGDTNINFAQPIAGVDVDAKGVLKVRQFDRDLERQRFLAARRAGDSELMTPSKLRKVSLKRLEAAVAAKLAAGETLNDELRSLAGLTSIQYVFFYPQTQDIVVAGPSEGFFIDATERLVGMQSGQPVVLLEDLVTALRAFAPQRPATDVISVSIDPTAQGLQRLQQFLRQAGGNATPAQTQWLAENLKNNLGYQNVTIRGVSPQSHFARVLVEADYRMKLIGIGLEQLPIPMASYVARANPNAVAANAMERWYFQPKYDAITVSEDGLAMQINGRGVELIGANERVGAGGERQKSQRVNRASEAFCKDFTKLYPEIAQRVRIYAELQQLIDLAIAAAYIQERDFYGQADWTMPVLGSETELQVDTYSAPQQVETAVNAIWRGNTLMTPLGGGVSIQPRMALRSENVSVDATGDTDQAKASAGATDLAEGVWWWD